MHTTKKRISFIDSEEGLAIRHALQAMADDLGYNTGSSYSANVGKYPDSLIPFVDKHLNYLTAHPNLEPSKYLANLRLMTRIR